jgi:MYXO-CTERM domain-containing protein
VLAYAGDRTSQTSFGAYRGLLADTATWITEDGAGDQHNNGIAPDVPFATDSFAVVPEPSAAGLAFLGLIPALRRRRSVII